MLTQALWFSLPFSVHYWHWQTGLEPLDAQQQIADYAMMIFVGHGLQYLWITTYYARASGHWNGYANYWAKAARVGRRDLDAARGADRPELVRERARPRGRPVRA